MYDDDDFKVNNLQLYFPKYIENKEPSYTLIDACSEKNVNLNKFNLTCLKSFKRTIRTIKLKYDDRETSNGVFEQNKKSETFKDFDIFDNENKSYTDMEFTLKKSRVSFKNSVACQGKLIKHKLIMANSLKNNDAKYFTNGKTKWFELSCYKTYYILQYKNVDCVVSI